MQPTPQHLDETPPPRINTRSLQWWRTSLGWSFHNLVGHPLSEAFFWGAVLCPPLRRPLLSLSDTVHDKTVPSHDLNTGRG